MASRPRPSGAGKTSKRTLISGLLIGVLSLTLPIDVLGGGGATHAALTFSTYHSFGDSITHASPSYANILATANGWTLTNYAQNGYRGCDMGSQVSPHENPGASGNPLYTILIGTNDAQAVKIGAHERIYQNCVEASASWLSIPITSKVPATACTATGSWSADDRNFVPGLGLQSSSSGNTLSCSIAARGGVLYAWYLLTRSGGGVFTYSVDGGAPVPLNVTPDAYLQYPGFGLIRVTGLSAGRHAMQFTVTRSGGIVSILGVGTPASTPCCKVLIGGVLRQQNDRQAADTAAYNTDALDAASTLIGDGLNVAFVPVRHYVNDKTDMRDTLHPNYYPGQLNLKTAFAVYQ
jgi:hypothetical protein